MQTSKIWLVLSGLSLLLVGVFTWLAKDTDKNELTVADAQEVPVSNDSRKRILREGLGFEVRFEDVEAFLRAEDLYGWPEGQRNWIGDEMMTMLRQEMPAKAYQLFADIQRDETAPAAMRDYSIQHISHLISDGQVGGEGVNLIRAALESENPVVASTALISLHNLSQKSVGNVAPEDVSNLVQQYQDSTDQRLQITARSIERALSELK